MELTDLKVFLQTALDMVSRAEEAAPLAAALDGLDAQRVAKEDDFKAFCQQINEEQTALDEKIATAKIQLAQLIGEHAAKAKELREINKRLAEFRTKFGIESAESAVS